MGGGAGGRNMWGGERGVKKQLDGEGRQKEGPGEEHVEGVEEGEPGEEHVERKPERRRNRRGK